MEKNESGQDFAGISCFHNRFPDFHRDPTSKSGVAQWLACWAHNPKVCGSKQRSANFVLPPPAKTSFSRETSPKLRRNTPFSRKALDLRKSWRVPRRRADTRGSRLPWGGRDGRGGRRSGFLCSNSPAEPQPSLSFSPPLLRSRSLAFCFSLSLSLSLFLSLFPVLLSFSPRAVSERERDEAQESRERKREWEKETGRERGRKGKG